jgi:hypothetical protein
MDEDLKQNLTRRSTWIRIVYMVLFAVIFSIVEFIVLAIAVVQLITRLFSGSVNEELQTLGDRIGRYMHQIVAFQTFHTEERPYPFAPFPTSRVHGGTVDSVNPG